MRLAKLKCVPCEVKIPPMPLAKARKLVKQTRGWRLDKRGWLVRDYKFRDFKQNMAFANRVARLAEREGHHPNIYVNSWNKLRLELYTHFIGGLSENDFILAAKISELKQ